MVINKFRTPMFSGRKLTFTLAFLCLGMVFFIVPHGAFALTPNDPYYSGDYEVYLPKIQADKAWDIITGSSNVVVAVIDDGIDTNHVELSNNIWTNSDEVPGNGIDDDNNGYVDDLHGWDFAYNTRELTPTGDHGSMVAGIIGAIGNNGIGVAGINWNVKLMPLIVFDFYGSGSSVNIDKAIRYATDNGAQIINLSIGGAGWNYDYSTYYNDAITYAFARGVTIVIAAGNGQKYDGVGRNLNVNPGSPVCNDGNYNMAIGVAAVDDNDVKTTWSDYGSNCIDVSAPGILVLSTSRTSHGTSGSPDYSYGSGTSFAAPIVTGVAALIKARYPAANNVQIADMIRRSADNIDALNPNYAGHLGAGRVNAFSALSLSPDPNLSTPDLIPPLYGLPASTIRYYVYTNSLKERSFDLSVANSSRYPYFEWSGAVDENSGVKGYYINLSTDINADAANGSFQTNASFQSPRLATDGTYYLHIKVADNAGNVSFDIYLKYIFQAESTMPTLQQPYVYSDCLLNELLDSNTTYINTAPCFKWPLASDDSGISGYYVNFSTNANADARDGIFQTSNFFTPPSLTVDGTYYLHVKAVDNSDNVSTGVRATYKFIKPQAFIVTGTKQGGGPEVRVLTTAGKLLSSFNAYPDTFKGGINVAVGDIDGNGIKEIITSTRIGGIPTIKVFDVYGNNLKWDFNAYDSKFRGGINIAVGDIEGDGPAEIAVAPMSGGSPNVRIFGMRNGKIVPVSENFLAYDKNFRGGIAISIGDINGDGIGDIITTPTSRGGPHIRVFGVRNKRYVPVTLGIMAYAPTFRGGINSTVGDVNGDGKDEIITGIVGAGGPHVRIFGVKSNKTIGLLYSGFMAYDPSFRGGISVASIDANGDNYQDEIITGVGGNGNPTIRIFNWNGKQVLKEFNAYSTNYKNGITLTAGYF